MRHKTTQSLYNYWNDIRGGRIAPQRLDIQPAVLGDLLPDTFILERLDAHAYPFRLAGTRVSIRLGTDLRGENFLDRWSPSDRDMLRHHLADITELGRVGVFTAEADFLSKRGVCVEIIMLPLVHTGTAKDRLLCALSVLDDSAGLMIERATSMRLLAAEAIWPDGRPYVAADRMSNQSPLSPRVRNARIVRQDRRQFRVYDGGLAKGDGEKL